MFLQRDFYLSVTLLFCDHHHIIPAPRFFHFSPPTLLCEAFDEGYMILDEVSSWELKFQDKSD